MDQRKKIAVIPFVVLALVVGALAGLYRIGWIDIPASYAGQHGGLMVGSFLGTLICLERAVVIKKRLIFLIPLVSGLSGLFFILDLHIPAKLALIVAGAGLTSMFIYFYRKTKEVYHLVMLCGAVCWLVGNIILLVRNMYPITTTWWIAFLFLTIAGERLELTKFLPMTPIKRLSLFSGLVIFFAGLIVPFHTWGKYFFAGGLMITAIWLLKFDMAGKSLKRPGLSRYSAIALITGYVWLLVSGLFFVKGEMAGYLYDAALHSFFIGFVFSMIFAHGPIILPGIAGISFKPYHPALYVWLILLHTSLAMRIGADLAFNIELRMWGGMINAIVILAFFVSLGLIVKFGHIKEPGRVKMAK